MLHLIKKVEYIEDYKLKLTFNDKKQKIVDLRKYSKEGPETVFYPFRDLDFFKSVKLDAYTGTVVWPNGVDLCPDVLYETGKDVEQKKKSTKIPSRRRKQRMSGNAQFKYKTAIAKKVSKKRS